MSITPTNPPRIGGKASLVKIGGSLGIAASFLVLAIFLTGIFGIYAVFMLSILPLILSGIGLVLAVVGAVKEKYVGDEETQPLSALFVCVAGLIGGLIELYLWRHLH